SQNGQRYGKPTIGRTKQNCPGRLITVLVVYVQMWMTAAAGGNVVFRLFSERMHERAGSAACIALHPQVLGLKRRTAFEESQCSLATCRAPMHEPMPRKII